MSYNNWYEEIHRVKTEDAMWIAGFFFEPCPICHGLNINYMSAGTKNLDYAVYCEDCGLRTPTEFTIEDCHCDWKRGVVDRKSLMLAVRKTYPVYDGT